MGLKAPWLTPRAKVRRFKRKIISRSYYRTPSHPKKAKDSLIVTLECGHVKRYKGSKAPISNHAMCGECKQ